MSTVNQVVVVEDDADTRANLADLLELDGYTVETAASVADASQRGALRAASVVLLDRKLPDGSADRQIPHIREVAPDTSLIIITGYPDVEGAIASLREGATDYILKPINPDMLRATLAKTFEHRALVEAKRRAEEAQRREHDFAERLIETARAIILVLDRQGRIVRFNSYLEQLTGYTLEEVRGENWFDRFIPDRERQRIRQVFDGSIAGQPTSGNVNPIVARDGTEREIEWSDTLLADDSGEPFGIIAVGQDITERVRAERALRDREARLRTIVETAVDGIFIFDGSGTIESVNPAAERLFAYERDALVGRKMTDLLGGPDKEALEEMLLDSDPKRDALLGRREMQGCRSDGEQFPLDLSISEVALPEGHLYVAIAHDLSEHRRLMRQILETSSQEQQRIGQDLHDGLSQSLTGVSFLLSTLRQRLAAKGLPEAADAGQLESLVKDAMGQLRGVIKGLSPYRLEADGLVVALEELANHAEQVFGVRCEFTCGATVVLDDVSIATHLHYIAREAVHNAVRHGRAQHIRIRVDRDGSRASLRVEDDGVGLPSETARSTGHGLRIMDYRARMIGGTLDVRRVGDRGTAVTCRFELPNGKEANDESWAESQAEATSTSDPR